MVDSREAVALAVCLGVPGVLVFDTLYGLAKKYGTSWTKIQKANGISGSTIQIGQKLKILR